MNAAMLLNSGTDFVKVNVSNSRNDSVAFEVKISKSITVADLKQKLEILTGGSAASMQVEVFNNEKSVCKLTDDTQLVGALPIDTGNRLHVVDNFQWISEENVEKFELSDDQYTQRQDTLREYLRKNQLGKYNEEEVRQQEEKRQQQRDLEQKHLQQCTVGARCQVKVAGHPVRRGTIMYKGPIAGKTNTFIGIKYDEPLGKNDGSINSERYFTCPPNYGSFVLPSNVEVGDFPPEKCELDEDDEI